MKGYTHRSELLISDELEAFISNDVLPGLNLDVKGFWYGFAKIITEFTPKNQLLLLKRHELQEKIDQWYQDPSNNFNDYHTHLSFLRRIGYVQPEGPDFTIETTCVDKEIAELAGPQLVVPVNNARFALNAANARWGSLYDALYGTDVIDDSGDTKKTKNFNPKRGKLVIDYAKDFLDQAIPLFKASHNDAVGYFVEDQKLVVELKNGHYSSLENPKQCIGFSGKELSPSVLLFKNNGIHIELHIDHEHVIGKGDSAGIADIVLESALTTIMDCEDSVAAVDGSDKTLVYKNWFGLIKGDLKESIDKNGHTFTRFLNADRHYTGLDRNRFSLPGRSMMFIRNVGHLMTTPAVLTIEGDEVFEGIVDAVITSLIASYDLTDKVQHHNSKEGSIYIVKPKMHGPEEVAFTVILFERIERLLKLPENTLKIGIMDEERRTSLNLKECIRAAKQRVVFINTGFLDRTGDEIHTSMHAGPFAPKAELKTLPWIETYEERNVAIGLACGFQGRAQIGKGMWAMPDRMADMLKAKIDHPRAGANTAWVPSPTAATLHAMHYHQVDVTQCQTGLKTKAIPEMEPLLKLPLCTASSLTSDQVQRELDNNIQGILGYVVRWVDQGVGCSKVPDIHGIGLMEDRATLRISSQHIGNWLKHGLVTKEQVLNSLHAMAKIVDEQNSHDQAYHSLLNDHDNNTSFRAAQNLIFEACVQPNGYTEPLLHSYRLFYKKVHHIN